METLKMLTRDEMKSIKAGNMNPCAIDCLSTYSPFLQECLDTYEPPTDERAQCINEVESLSDACMDRC